MLTFTNSKTNATVTTELSRPDLLNEFNKVAGQDHWIWYWIVKTIQDAKSNEGNKDMIAFLADSFLFALGMGLKKPMIRLSFDNRRYKVYLSARGTLCFKSGALVEGTNDPIGEESYIGCLYNNRFLPNRERNVLTTERVFLDRLSNDPVGFMATCSRDMNRCCYCNLPLEDTRSKQVGYGKVCAGRWGLPWGETSDHNVPSFAQLWARSGIDERRNVRMMCQAIRKNPHDALSWEILGDALEEAGWQGKKPTMPIGRVVVPNL